MTYTLDVPVTGNTLGGTRDIIRTNFQRLSVVFDNNHYTYNNSNEGKHRTVQLPNQGTLKATGVSEGAIGCLVSPDALAELNYLSESNNFVYQLTRTDPSPAVNASFGTTELVGTASTRGWTFLPGGLILNYGTRAAVDNSANPVVFAKPFTTAFIAGFVSGATTTFNPTSPTLIGMVVGLTGIPGTIYWQAIGK